MFSAEYLTDRELNRTGEAPQALVKSLSAGHLAADDSSKASNKHAGKATPLITATAAGFTPGSRDSGDGTPTDSPRDAESLVVLPPPGKGVPSTAAGSKGLTLPFTPQAVAFKNINYYVDLPVSASHSAQRWRSVQ